MIAKENVISLLSLASGAALERFDDELRQVLKNIVDVNTEAKAKRVIQLQVEFIPNEERQHMTIEIKCSSKLAGPKPVATFGYIGQDGDEPIATEYNPKQGKLYDAKEEGESK